MIFDGKVFASEIEAEVIYKVRNLVKKPKIVSILVGNDPASVLYSKLKKKAAERVGIMFEIYHYTNEPLDHLKNEIIKMGQREDVTGVMVQLPLPEVLRGETSKLLAMIPLGKDVDGLRWQESGIMPATVRAILSILDKIAENSKFEIRNSKIVVVGAGGSVGRPLCHFLRERGVEVSEVEWDTPDPARTVLAGEVVISCVGKAGIVTGEMVSEGAVVIDVGMSMVGGKAVGDMTQEVYQTASVAVAVPNGVGPVTIVSLLANAEELYVFANH